VDIDAAVRTTRSYRRPAARISTGVARGRSPTRIGCSDTGSWVSVSRSVRIAAANNTAASIAQHVTALASGRGVGANVNHASIDLDFAVAIEDLSLTNRDDGWSSAMPAPTIDNHFASNWGIKLEPHASEEHRAEYRAAFVDPHVVVVVVARAVGCVGVRNTPSPAKRTHVDV